MGVMIKMKKVYLIFLLGLFFISFSGAYTSHKQTTDYVLSLTSNNATECNLSSIQYPDGTNSILNLQLIKNGNFFYNNINNNNYTKIGTTCHYIVCTDGINYEDGNICIEITPSGFVWSSSFYIILILLSIGIIVLGYYVQDAWIVVLGSFGMVLFGLLVLFYGISGIKDNVYTWGIGIITLMTGAYFGIKGSLEKLDN